MKILVPGWREIRRLVMSWFEGVGMVTVIGMFHTNSGLRLLPPMSPDTLITYSKLWVAVIIVMVGISLTRKREKSPWSR